MEERGLSGLKSELDGLDEGKRKVATADKLLGDYTNCDVRRTYDDNFYIILGLIILTCFLIGVSTMLIVEMVGEESSGEGFRSPLFLAATASHYSAYVASPTTTQPIVYYNAIKNEYHYINEYIANVTSESELVCLQFKYGKQCYDSEGKKWVRK